MKTLIAIFISFSFGYAQLNKSVGTFQSVVKDQNSYLIKTENSTIKLSMYSPTIIRVRINNSELWDDFSYAIIRNADAKSNFLLSESATKLTFATDSLQLVVTKFPVRFAFYDKKNRLLNEDEPSFGTSWLGEEFTTYKKIQADEKFIGLGEKTGGLNRRGSSYVNANTDAFGYGSNADPLYQSIPFYMGIHNGLQYGIFYDNSHKTHFNFGASNDRFMSFGSEAGEMNYYFIGNSSVANIIQSYSFLTGTIEMPPYWSLGYQQCKYSYYPDEEVLSIAKTFRDKKLPIDVMYLDIHYMDAYKVFTWNKDRFPDPKKMTSDLKKMGIRTAVILDPGIKIEKGYPAYDQGVKDSLYLTYPDNTYYSGQVWPGWCHFPDFTNGKVRDWWGNAMKEPYVDNGIEGFWNDMNEIATWGQNIPNLVQFYYEGKKTTFRQGRNIYGLNMARSTFEGTKKLMNGERPFVLTRAGYAGIQRYSAVWTGDNVSSDEHMMLGVRLMNSMGISGIPVTGMDIGGFTGNPTPNLYARWMSIGAFSPFCRSHVAIDQKEQEPWSFGKKVEAISRNYINLRYKLLPYLYSNVYKASTTGLPIQRSLTIDYAHDSKIYDDKYQNQFFCGDGIMVAPTESWRYYMNVYLPGNDWYEFYNDKYYKGNEEILTTAPVERLPVYVKGGSIITTQSLTQSTVESPTDTLVVNIYNGKAGSTFVHYEDDGKTYQFETGNYFKRTISLDNKNKKLSFDKADGKSKSKFKSIKVQFHGYGSLSKLKAKSENFNLLSSILNFDPIGSANNLEVAKISSLTVENKSDKFTIAW